MKKVFVISLVLMLNSCMSIKKAESDKVKKAKTEIKDLSKEGFTYVETVTTKNVSPCDLLFKTKTEDVFEITNFHSITKGVEEAYWIKFRRLRRMSKCENAQPIEVTEIEKAEFILDK